MRRLPRTLGSLLIAIVVTVPVMPSAADAPLESGFIVVLRPSAADVDAAAARLSDSVDAEVTSVYETALDGFAITASEQEAAALASDPAVAWVERDVMMSVDAQSTSTGLGRTFAAGNRAIDIDGADDVRVDVDVAVIDTGIDLQHPDLNIAGGVNCTVGPVCVVGGDDDGFHGTHVAGTIGALDNGFGVVGVAPGARLWAVKVLDSVGDGLLSWILRGVDWVAANAGTIEVANLSLGTSGSSQAFQNSIRAAVDGGVAIAVAAGNSDESADTYIPASYDEVLAVSALADFDGRPGGTGAPTCRPDQDDTLADFSNWGTVIDIAAPGVCITSTVPLEQGSYAVVSGTSMASPHVAGALALVARAQNPNSAADVEAMYDAVVSAGNFGWVDDSGDGVREPLLDLSAPGLFAAALPPCASISATGLLAWWSGGDVLTGVVGPSLAGTSAFAPAAVGRGFRTDSSSTLSTAGVAAVGQAVTVEAWVKPTAARSTVQVLASRWDFPSTDDSARSFSLSLMPAGDLVFETDDISTRRPIELRAGAPVLSDGGFHHVAATRDATRIALYVDGAEVASMGTTTGSLNGALPVPVRVGSKSGIGDPFRYIGVIDEPSVWARALTASEVSAIVAAGPSGKCMP